MSGATSAALVGTAATAATATTAATAATAGLIGSAGLVGGVVSLGSLATGALTAFSALGAIQGGRQQAAVAKGQAQQYALSAKQEEIKGREQADNIRRSLQATIASQNATFAARGISLAGGTPNNLANVSKTNASNDIATAQFGASEASAALNSQSQQSTIAGRSARTSSYATAAGSLIKQYGA